MTVGYDGFKEASPQEVNAFHKNADTDSSWHAAHHTLGTKKNQAAPGDHHETTYPKLTDTNAGIYWNPNVRNDDGSALSHTPVYYRYWNDGVGIHYVLNFNVEAGSGQFVRFDLPVATANPVGTFVMCGSGREDNVTGYMLLVRQVAPQIAQIFRFDNQATAVFAYWIRVSGWYPLNQV